MNAQKCNNISAIANVSDSTDRTIKCKVRKSGPILPLKMSRDTESETEGTEHVTVTSLLTFWYNAIVTCQHEVRLRMELANPLPKNCIF